MNTEEMLREAREAALSGDFSTARTVYRRLRDDPGFKPDLNLTIRFAYCSERTGDYTEALAAYREALEEYKKNGDDGAAEVINGLIHQIRQYLEELDSREGKIPDHQITLDNAPDEAEVMTRLMRAGQVQHLQTGDTLCRQGEPPNHLWLLTSGEIEVHVPGYADTDVLRGQEGSPCLLGELGYFTGQRRAATLVARTDVELIEIAVKLVHAMCDDDQAMAFGLERFFRERLVERVLSRHAIFERINDVDRKKLAMAFEYLEMGPGEVLIEPGSEHHAVYLVQTGCLLLMPAGEEREDKSDSDYITSMLPGDIIHLGGLLHDYRADYRVVTATPARLLYLSREQFRPFALRRPWVTEAILKHSRMPAQRQVMRPDEDYLWHVNRQVHLPKRV